MIIDYKRLLRCIYLGAIKHGFNYLYLDLKKNKYLGKHNKIVEIDKSRYICFRCIPEDELLMSDNYEFFADSRFIYEEEEGKFYRVEDNKLIGNYADCIKDMINNYDMENVINDYKKLIKKGGE